jgi:hypothetical protein
MHKIAGCHEHFRSHGEMGTVTRAGLAYGITVLTVHNS